MIIFLHGKDAFRRQLKLEALKEKHLEPGMEALNLVQVKNPELIDFISTVKTPGFGFGTKVIIVKDFQYLENKSEDKEVNEIIATLKNLPDNLVLIFENDKISGTIKLVKQIKSKLKEIVQFEDFTPFTTWDTKGAANWLMKSSRDIDAELNLDISAAEHLVEQIGSDNSSNLYSELKRLSLIAENKKVSIELIDRECASKHDLFKFIKLLSENNISKANKELDKIIQAKDAHLGLVSVLGTSINRYLKLKHAQAKRLDKNALAGLLGVTPGRVYFMSQEVQRMDINHLETLNNKLYEVERSMKHGKMPIEKGLKYLVNS